MSDAQFDPSMGSIQAAAAAANATALQNSIKSTSAVSGSADGVFNGTLGDLKKNYPEVYDKLIIESIGRQICQQSKDANDRYIAEIKKHSR
ncbi:MAG: hypothetical protein LLF94_03725 [Chlamydiales bacterium]|nr:hypothetical protein [Chlamydiales bacterium]